MALIVDADSHFFEPLDLWEQYVEHKYKERALRVLRDEATGLETVVIDGKPSALPPGTFRLIVGFGQPADLPASFTFREGPVGAYDMAQRIQWLDAEGIDKQLIYPSMAVIWEAEVDDPEIAAVYCRAYNNWAWEVCGPYADRLLPGAHISLRDVDEAVRELRRVARMGFRGVFISSRPLRDHSFGSPACDPFWAEAQELGIPVGIHPTGNLQYTGSAWRADLPLEFPHLALGTPQDVRMVLTTLIYDGVLERFPRLKVVAVEAKSGWIGELLERMDHFLDRFASLMPRRLRLKPSEYFARQCWISADPEETTLPAMIDLVGADKFFWGSDFPHMEGFPHPVHGARERLRTFPESTQRKILGENAAAVYNLN